MPRSAPPDRQGLYDPQFERDACGLGFVAHIKGLRSHDILRKALELLVSLEHRGACGSESNTGDGAGILMQMPDRFLRAECDRLAIALPAPGDYAVAMTFLPRDPGDRTAVETLFEGIVGEEGQRVLGWRDVPTDDRLLGPSARAGEPVIRQLFIARGEALAPAAEGADARLRFERKLFVIKKRVEREADALPLADRRAFYVVSLSANTLIYKGMLTASQIEPMFPDLTDPLVESALALVHQRFSTNTFPSWPLAHPYRLIAHNGEINTVRGNINWMRAREGLLRSGVLGEDLQKVLPIIREGEAIPRPSTTCWSCS